MADRPGPVPTIISVVRRAAALMIDDLIARLDAAGFVGLTPAHQAVFENLDPGGTRLTELAARAAITHQSMSELVSALEQRGYLERRPDPSDGRARIVRLTPTGRQMARKAIKEMAAIEAEWRNRLAREGLKGDIVAALTQALATQQPRPAAEMADTARPDPPRSI
jgi:DNA-binding MarR family transcriptional regulator